MARRTAQPPAEVPLYLAMLREEASRKIAERIEGGEELKSRPIPDHQTFKDVERDYWTWDEYNEEMLRRMFTSPEKAKEYRGVSFGSYGGYGVRHLRVEIEDLHRSIDDKIRRLTSVNERLELIPLAPGVGKAPPASKGPPSVDSGRVFVVHGHDEGARETVARFVGNLGLTPIILHEQASRGDTVIQKLERHGDVGFAVILLTPDDVGGKMSTSPDDLLPRARQNVIMELGYFLARLGRDRVCALHRGELELPSDYMGVVYISFDSGGG